MDTQYKIAFITDRKPGIAQLLQRLPELEPTTGPTSPKDGIEYDVGMERRQCEEIDTAVSEIEGESLGAVYLKTDSGMVLNLMVMVPESAEEAWFGRTAIDFRTVAIDARHQPNEVIETRIDELFRVTCQLTEHVRPEFVWSSTMDENERYESVKPTGRPIRDHVRDLSWITVMSPEVVEQFGGREHVLETPAYRVEALDTGHIALMLEDHPYDPSADGHGHWKRHLLKD